MGHKFVVANRDETREDTAMRYPGIVRIAFTGGPCGGKTTAIEHVSRVLESSGFRALRVPEAVHLVFAGGGTIDDLEGDRVLAWEAALLRLVISLEDTFTDMARIGGLPTVVLCDRGSMDIAAHLPPETWQALLSSGAGYDERELRDERYDFVIHLESTAVHHPEAFDTRNNPFRTNGLTWARDLDRRCREVWSAHPARREIPANPAENGLAERLCQIEAVVATLVEPLRPPPLPLRVLLTAEPFGFGPSAAITQIFHYLRPRLATLAFAGAGHTLDIQTGLSYDKIHDLTAADADPYASLTAVVADYDALITSCDFRAAEIAHKLGIPVTIYDPLAWYWKDLPAICRAVDLYIAQDFFGVREAIRGIDFQNLTVVPPLVPLDVHGQEPRSDLALLNLGGLKNPFLTDDECAAYANTVVDAVLPVVCERFREVEVITNAATARSLHARFPPARAVTPGEAQSMMARCRLALMTPGLGNIYEAAVLSARAFWLPPANDSQGQQLRILRDHKLAPHGADWHELVGSGDVPIDYQGPQKRVMEQVAYAIRCAIVDRSFKERLRVRVSAAIDATDAETLALRALVGMFGRGGDRIAANAILRQMLIPLARRKEARHE